MAQLLRKIVSKEQKPVSKLHFEIVDSTKDHHTGVTHGSKSEPTSTHFVIEVLNRVFVGSITILFIQLLNYF